MIGIQQEIRLKIPRTSISDMHLSVPDWSQEQIGHTYGLVRDYPRTQELHDRAGRGPVGGYSGGSGIPIDAAHGQLCRPVQAYDTAYRRLYRDHVGRCISPTRRNAILAIGNGNLISNLGIVGCVVEGCASRLLKAAWEEKRMARGWRYSCLTYDRRENRAGIDRFAFQHGGLQPKRDLAWLTSGQPILWDGGIPQTEDLIAETYDIRHIYTLRSTTGDTEERERAYHKIQEYMKVWIEVFAHESQATAAERLKAAARQPEFAFDRLRRDRGEQCLGEDREVSPFIEKRYMQSAVGVSDEGDILIVQKHGSMKEIGLTLKDMGATRGILLDQGGSVGTFYRPPAQGSESELSGDFLFRSRDLRTSRLSILILELNTDRWSEA